jgi:hypothetical protein
MEIIEEHIETARIFIATVKDYDIKDKYSTEININDNIRNALLQRAETQLEMALCYIYANLE